MNGEALLQQQAQAFLAQLAQQNDRLIGALLVSPDGLLVAHHLTASTEVDKIAAMTAALHALGKEIGATLALGNAQTLQVHCESGETYMMNAGNYTLAIISRVELQQAVLEETAQQAAVALAKGEVFAPAITFSEDSTEHDFSLRKI